MQRVSDIVYSGVRRAFFHPFLIACPLVLSAGAEFHLWPSGGATSCPWLHAVRVWDQDLDRTSHPSMFLLQDPLADLLPLLYPTSPFTSLKRFESSAFVHTLLYNICIFNRRPNQNGPANIILRMNNDLLIDKFAAASSENFNILSDFQAHVYYLYSPQ